MLQPSAESVGYRQILEVGVLSVSAPHPQPALHEEHCMSKGMDRKKEGKKKPAKTLEEKRAAKREKKSNRG